MAEAFGEIYSWKIELVNIDAKRAEFVAGIMAQNSKHWQ
jgi:hypothetical protein